MNTYFLVIPGKQIIPLTGDRITIGRAPAEFVQRNSISGIPTAQVHGETSQLYLFSNAVSPQHAILTLEDDGNYSLELEQDHSNTFVNGEPVHSSTSLKRGDWLEIGPYEFFVTSQSVPRADPTLKDERGQIISCRWCGHELFSTEEACPHCGDLAPTSGEELAGNALVSEASQHQDYAAQDALGKIAILHHSPDPGKTKKRYCPKCQNWVLGVEQNCHEAPKTRQSGAR